MAEQEGENVENKKIDVLFGLVVIAFLSVTILLIKEFKSQSDYKEYTSDLTAIIIQKNDRVRILSTRLANVEKENQDLRNTLTETRNSLDSLGKKLVEPPAAAPAVPAATTK